MSDGFSNNMKKSFIQKCFLYADKSEFRSFRMNEMQNAHIVPIVAESFSRVE